MMTTAVARTSRRPTSAIPTAEAIRRAAWLLRAAERSFRSFEYSGLSLIRDSAERDVDAAVEILTTSRSSTYQDTHMNTTASPTLAHAFDNLIEIVAEAKRAYDQAALAEIESDRAQDAARAEVVKALADIGISPSPEKGLSRLVHHEGRAIGFRTMSPGPKGWDVVVLDLDANGQPIPTSERIY